MRKLTALLISPLAFLLAACTGIPRGIEAVSDFQLERYLGKWYEIARLDHSFERGLSDVSAVYARRAEGGVSVLNRGYDSGKGQWKEAQGKADFIDSDTTTRGSLKVSFFGPFYGGYHIVALDTDYRWSLVVGPDRDYLWILARDRRLPEAVKTDLVAKARHLGFATDKLIWVSQERPDA